MLKNLNLQYLLSYLGLIPYILILLDKYFFFQIKEEIVINFSIYYTLIILVFIGAINWNLEQKIINKLAIYGFFPSLIALLIIILNLYNFNSSYLFLFLIFVLALQLLFDYILIYSRKSVKKSFYLLRFPLTILIIFCLNLTIFL